MAKKPKKSIVKKEVVLKRFKGEVFKNFSSGGVNHKVGDVFRTDSKQGLQNLINNGFIKSNAEQKIVDEFNKKLLKWQQ
tara:strand:- start:704 stop:940 length:237 start_codon:yes stop_codon:yes gene_type:complete